MQFWKYKNLAIRMRSKEVTEKEKLLYFMCSFVASCVTGTLACSQSFSRDFFIGALLFIGINILGYIYCYNANTKGDNKEFIERAICLGFPIMIRMQVLSILLLVLYFICMGSYIFFNATEVNNTTIAAGVEIFKGYALFIESAMLAVTLIYYFTRLNKAILIVSK